MNSLKTLKKQRRYYLYAKGKAVLATTLWSMLFVCLIFVAVFSGLSAGLGARPYHELMGMRAVLFYLCLAVLTGWQIAKTSRRIEAGQKAIAAVPYVPPVALETLPDVILLVRASEDSTRREPQQAVLLRALAENQQTPLEQLLRVK